MREAAAAALDGVKNGRSTIVARVVAFEGFGGRSSGEAVTLVDGDPIAGSLLGGLAGPLLAELAESPPGLARLERVSVGDSDAVAAGLACGGSATVLVSDAGLVEERVWAAIGEGAAVAVVTQAKDDGRAMAFVRPRGSEAVEISGSLGSKADDERAAGLAEQALGARGSSTAIYEADDGSPLVIECIVPVTSLLVIGEGTLAEAISAQAALLGWPAAIAGEWDGAARRLAESLRPEDAIVVLSHDPEVYTPALLAALSTGCYVGALGSRHTQQLRKERLAAEGASEEAIARIHGPVGLDLGARTPAETAVAIVAEILAARAGRNAASLSSTSGPING
jgi:xanthine dehydrogenase accessory factor